MTLVELLVAMALLVIIGGATVVFVRGITRAWQTGAIRSERYQQARLLFDLFSRELSSSVANPRYPMVGTDAVEAAPLHAGSVLDELFFTGTLPGRAGLVERGYWVDAAGDLMCHDDEPADGDYATGTSELCGRDVAQFTLSYFDGAQWLDRWDGRSRASDEGVLPKAIRIALAVGRDHPERFETVIDVPTS